MEPCKSASCTHDKLLNSGKEPEEWTQHMFSEFRKIKMKKGSKCRELQQHPIKTELAADLQSQSENEEDDCELDAEAGAESKKRKKSTSEELQQDFQAENSTSWIIKKGEDLICEARVLEERANIEQAVSLYCQGTTLILQGMSGLGAKHPLRTPLLQKVATCVRHAEDLSKAPAGD